MALKKILRGLELAPDAEDEGTDIRWATILYVEDDDANWDVASLLLTRKYWLERARTAREVVSKLEERSFDLILMDIELQGSELDGIQLTKLLRGKLLSPPGFVEGIEPMDVPILFMTAYSARYGEQELVSYGGDGVVPKPVDPEELNAAIWRMLSRQRLVALDAVEKQKDAEDELEHFKAIQMESEQQIRGAERAFEHEKRLRKQMENFLHTISHELTTPLTLILNPLQSLVDAQPDNAEVSLAHKHARELLDLVHTVLEVQKLEFNKKSLDLVAMDFGVFVTTAAKFFQVACDGKNIAFQMALWGRPVQELTERVPIMGHPESIERVVANVLTHALGRTPRGGTIRLNISLEGGRVRLSVSDSGAHMEDGVLADCFEMVGSKSSGSQSTGLGLSLVKALVEEMGGDVGIQSSAGEGVEVWLEFRLADELNPVVDVLVVDDDPDIRTLLMHRLTNSEKKMTVRAAASVSEAFELLVSIRARCIIADYEMDDRDGLSCLEEVSRRLPETKRVLLTGHADTSLMRRAVNEARVHRAFYKPVDHVELVDAIELMVAESSLVDTVIQHEILPQFAGRWENIESNPLVLHDDEEEVSAGAVGGELVLVIEQVSDMRALIASVLKKRGYRVITASNGYRGLELAKQREPDLVVTGWELGSFGGLDVIGTFKRDSKISEVPVVLLTSKSDRESWAQGVESGADAFLGKPFSGLELLGTVESLLRLKKTKQAAVEQSRYLEAIFESMREGVLILDENANVREVNPSMSKMIETPSDALVGVSFFDLLESYDFTRLSGIDALVGDVESTNVIFARPSGEGISLSVSGVELCELRGRLVGYLLTARDQRRIQKTMVAESRQLAELKEARQEIANRSGELERAYEDLKQHQDQIIQTEKLASLGSMVAGVAHEINTPIGVSLTASTHILPLAEDLKTQIRANTLSKTALVSFVRDSSEGLAIINANLNRAAELIRSFKQVAVDQTKLETRKILVHGYLQEIITSLGPELRRYQHRVHLVPSENDVELEIDPGSFAQVVTNLVLNALIHAFDEREGTMGTVTVSMTREEGDIEIRVGDDGHGISDENLARIFDPFFTTRKGRGGTGLGLHIVHTIVTTQLGGQIRCQSVIGEGTEFVILLPPSM